MSAPASRRGFLAAFAAFSGAGTTGALAATAERSGHDDHTFGDPGIKAVEPDAALLAAEARWREAVAFAEEATKRYGAAYRAEEAALGPCPRELVAHWDDDEVVPLLRFIYPDQRELLARETLWEEGIEGVTWGHSWTGAALRFVIPRAVTILGRGGRTPHVVRRLRSLIPLADARDIKRRAVENCFQSDALGDAMRDARKIEEEAVQRIIELPAATLTGVAVKLRYAEVWQADRREMSGWSLPLPGCFVAVHEAIRQATGGQA